MKTLERSELDLYPLLRSLDLMVSSQDQLLNIWEKAAERGGDVVKLNAQIMKGEEDIRERQAQAEQAAADLGLELVCSYRDGKPHHYTRFAQGGN